MCYKHNLSCWCCLGRFWKLSGYVTYVEGASHHGCVTGPRVLCQPLCVARLSYLRGVSCSAVLHPPHHDGQKPRAESSRACPSSLKLFFQVLCYIGESPVNMVSPSRWLSLHQDLCLLCLQGLKTMHTHYSVTSAWAVTNTSPFLSPLPVGEGKSGRGKGQGQQYDSDFAPVVLGLVGLEFQSTCDLGFCFREAKGNPKFPQRIEQSFQLPQKRGWRNIQVFCPDDTKVVILGFENLKLDSVITALGFEA